MIQTVRNVTFCLALLLPATAAGFVDGAAAAPSCHGMRATIVAPAGTTIEGTPDADVIVVTGSDYRRTIVRARAGNDIVCGGDGPNEIHGGPGDDRLYGGPTVSVLDFLFGGSGADVLRGGPSVDRLIGGAGDDRIYGGPGADELRFHGAADGGVRVDLTRHSASGADIGHDDVIGVESVFGTAGPDHLIGDDDPNVLDGRAGNDRITGHGGADQLRDGAGSDSVNGGAGKDEIFSNGCCFSDEALGHDWRDIDRVSGGSGDDLLKFAGGDTVDAGDGDDTLMWSGGRSADDDVAAGHLRGGHGRDWFLWEGQSPVQIDLLNGVYHGAGATGTITGIHKVWGGSEDDTLLGSDRHDRIKGRQGDDHIEGRAGNDVLVGGHNHPYQDPDSDDVDGGAGNDRCSGETTTNCETVEPG